MITKTAPYRVLAVLDWELATLGHPLADLAYNCMPFRVPTQQGLIEPGNGLPTFEGYVSSYLARTGRSEVKNYQFYEAFAVFRIAGILAGVYKRHLQGNSTGPSAAMAGKFVKVLAEAAMDTINNPLDIKANGKPRL